MTKAQRLVTTRLPTRYGEFVIHVYADEAGLEHVALTVGGIDQGNAVYVRLHSECLTGDVFESSRCDCGEQLARSLIYLQQEQCGVLLYMRQEGRGIGLANKIRAYALQDQGLDTVEANIALGLPEDSRDYGIAASMLDDLGVRSVRLLTNNPAKIDGLTRYGIAVTDRIPLETLPNTTNQHYLETKRDRMGHLLSLLEPVTQTPE